MQGSDVIRGVSNSDEYKTVLCIGEEDEVGRSAKGMRGLVWGLRLTGMRLPVFLQPAPRVGPPGKAWLWGFELRE